MLFGASLTGRVALRVWTATLYKRFVSLTTALQAIESMAATIASVTTQVMDPVRMSDLADEVLEKHFKDSRP